MWIRGGAGQGGRLRTGFVVDPSGGREEPVASGASAAAAAVAIALHQAWRGAGVPVS
jgi:hypothetical protein